MTAALTGIIGVLKIAGIIVLVLIGLILLIAGVILFAPIRYEMDAEIPETEIGKGFAKKLKEEARAKAGFRWLFHAVRGQIAYPEDLSFRVKALWFTIAGGGEEETPETKTQADAEGTPEPEEKKPEPEEKKPAAEEKKPAAEEKKPEPEEKKPEPEEKKPEPEEKKPAAEEKKPEPEPLYARLADFFIWISSFIGEVFTKPYEVFCKIQYTISRICDKISDGRMFLESETCDRAKTVVLKQTKRLLKGIDPKRCDIRVLYGTGDPALTADILAGYAVLYPVLSKYMTPEADFDRKVVGVRAHVRGRVTLFRILTCAGIVYFNRDVRTAYRMAGKLLAREKE